MIETKPVDIGIILINISGERFVFRNKQHAFDSIGYNFIKYHVGRKFVDRETALWNRLDRSVNNVMRNIYGDVITLADFTEQVRQYINSDHVNDHGANGNPIPGTGRRSLGRYWRHPKTFQTRRYICGVVEEEGEVGFRKKRKSLPTMWDDWLIQSVTIDNWKRYRKQRWKDNQPSPRAAYKKNLLT